MSPSVAVSGKAKRVRTPPATLVDPVTQYAADVRNGVIVAGRAVRLACRRHFNNLAQQRTKDFPYYFDVEAAQRIIDFFPTFLTLENGHTFTLPPWLQFSYGTIYGWKCADGERDGLRRFVHGYFETSKGSGKTPSAGGIALYGAGFDHEQFAEIYSNGFDKGQAAIILNDAIRMADGSPDDEFRAEFIVDKYNIAHPASGSFIRASSSQHRSKSGPRPHYVLSDEVHEQRDGTVITKMEAGFKNRAQPLGLKYTNSGSDKTSYCWQLRQKSMEVLEGTLVDEQWFAYICHLDPCEKCYDDGFRQPKDGCKDCDDWTNPKVWPKIAPALGIVIQEKYLQDAVDAALSMPSEYSMKRRLNFCIWTETHQVWIPSDRWEACAAESISTSNPDRRPCAAAFDLSSKIDLSAFVVALRFDDAPGAPAQTADIEGMDEDGNRIVQTLTLNFSVELVPFFWIPEETMLERVKNERINYDAWHRQGKLFVTAGPTIDHEEIYSFIVKDASKRFAIQRIGYDQHDATMLAAALKTRGRLGDKIAEVSQGKKLSEAFKLMEILVKSRRLRHDGHPVLAWNMANAEPHRDRLNALWIEKPSETKRIDGVIAAAMAIHQLMVLPSAKKKSGGVFFV